MVSRRDGASLVQEMGCVARGFYAREERREEKGSDSADTKHLCCVFWGFKFILCKVAATGSRNEDIEGGAVAVR